MSADDFDGHIRAGIDLGSDHFAKLEYRLPDGRQIAYPAGEAPAEADAQIIGLMENHKAPDGSWCGGWVGFTNMPGHHERAGHELVSVTPLTVSPSLACGRCTSHGFIREGRWVDA